MKRKYLLGIDIGVVKTAVVLIDAEMRSPVSSLHMTHNAGIACAAPGFAEQDMRKIEDSIRKLIMAVSADAKERICSIGVTGQMHSVMLWNDFERSNIITWQDRRASMAGNLQKYRRMSSRFLADGFGAVSMAELARTGRLSKWKHAATPADYLVTQLTGKREALTEPSFAASWGLLDPFDGKWDAVLAEKMGIPRMMLPGIAKTGSIAGITSGFSGLPDGIPVMNAIGDKQSSIAGLSCNDMENELFVTIGTEARVSALVTTEEAALYRYSDVVEIRPFDTHHMLVVTVSSCGGKEKDCSGMTIAPAQRMAGNMRSGFPDEIIRKRRKIIVSGDALRHCISIRKAIESVFGLPVEIRNITEEAATGAALLSGKSLNNICRAETAHKIKTIQEKTRIADYEKTYTSI